MHDDKNPLIVVSKSVAVPKDNVAALAWENQAVPLLRIALKISATASLTHLVLKGEEANDFWHQYTGEIITD